MTIHHRNDGSLVLENKRADHGGHILCTAISSHCELVATGGSERVVVWEADSIRELFRTEFGPNEPFSLAFSGDGNYLACGGFGGLVRIFHVHSRCESATFLAPVGFFPLLGVSFSPDSRLLASAGVINKADVVIVWDIEQRKSRQIFYGHSDSVWGVAFSPDGRSLASGAIDATVRVWDLETNQELMRLEGKGESVTWFKLFPPRGADESSPSR